MNEPESRSEARCRCLKNRSIRCVDKLTSNFQLLAFGQTERLQEAQVRVLKPRSAHGTHSASSECASGGRSEISGIEPLVASLGRILLAEDFGLMINVDITPDRYRALALKPNETVYVTPKSAKIFEADYSI